MVRRKLKLTSVFVLLIMLLSMVPDVSFAVSRIPMQTAPEFERVIRSWDGTSSEHVRGAFSATKDAWGNECYSLNGNTYITQLFFDFDDINQQETQMWNENGQCMLSFDFLAKQKSKGLMMYWDCTPKTLGYPFFNLSGAGKMYFNDRKHSDSPVATYCPDNARDYEIDRWYNIKMLFYRWEKYIDFYVDDVFWGRQYLPSSIIFNDKHNKASLGDEGAVLNNIFFNMRPDWELDANGYVLPATSGGQILFDNLTYGSPGQRAIEIDYWKNETGNVYPGDKVNFGCDLINRTDKTEKFTLNYEIRTDKNRFIKKDSVAYEVKPGEKKAVPMLDTAPEYGFYAVEAELYNSKGELVYEEDTRFSIVAPQPMLNPKLGVNTHQYAHGESSYGSIADTLDIAQKLGMSSIRDVFAWYSLYQTDGFTPANNNAVNASIDVGQTPLTVTATLANQTEVYYMDYDDVEAREDLMNRYAKYCRQVALDADPNVISHFEVENEFWLKGDEKRNGTKYDNVNVSPDVRLMADMIKIANREIKAVNPNAKIGILNPGLINVEWARACLEALGENPGQHFDAFVMHDYMASFGAQYPEQVLADGDINRPDKPGGVNIMLALLEEFGCTDKEIWSTEYGITSGYPYYDTDEELQSDLYVRHTMFSMQYMTKMYPYQLIRDRHPSSEYEAGFGFMRNGTKGEILIEAMPGGVAFAGYNSLLSGSEYVSTQIFESEGKVPYSSDVYIYKHKTREGKDCYAVFNATQEKMMSFDFGVDSAMVYDSYGNGTKINALDGYITLLTTTEPQYIIADDLKDEVTVRETPLFGLQTKAESAVDDAFSFEVTKDTSANLEINVECTANTAVNNIDDFSDGHSKIDMVTFNERQNIPEYMFDDDETKEEIFVNITDGNKVYFREPVVLRYLDSLQSDFRIMPYRNGRWQAILNLRNNKRTSSLSGKVEISTGDSEEIKNLLSGQRSTIRFNIPENVVKEQYSVDATILLSDGSVIEESAKTNFISVEKADVTPTIDGKMAPGEWKNSGQLIKFDNESQYVPLNRTDPTVWKGKDDLSGEMYLMYDDEYFYMAAKVKDDIHCGDDPTGTDRSWWMDSIQFAISEENEISSPYTELSVALADDGRSILQKYIDVNQGDPTFDKTTYNIFDEGTEVKIAIDGAVKTYEVKVPWSEITLSKSRPLNDIYFSALINENDGAGRNSFIQWGEGIGQNKTAAKFISLPMNK